MFSFQGKVNRSIFWITSVVNVFAVLVVVGANLALYVGLEGIPTVDPTIFRIILLISLIPLIPALWVLAAVTVKRFHDRNKSGWWALIALTGVGILWIIIECGFLKSVDVSIEESKEQVVTATPPVPVQATIVEEPKVVERPPIVETKKEEIPTEKNTTPFPSPTVVSHIDQPIAEPVIVPEKKVEPLSKIEVSPLVKTPVSPSSIPLETKAPTEPTPKIEEIKKESVPYTAPPVRSMAEMLAELQRLSQQHPAQKHMPPVATPAPQVAQVETKVPVEQKPPSALTTTLEDTPAPKTTDDLTSALNNIMAEAENSNQTEGSTVEEPILTTQDTVDPVKTQI